MDINCSRYFDSIGVSGYNKDTLKMDGLVL